MKEIIIETNFFQSCSFFLEDYASNGAYETDETIIEINGSDEILWQKTIDETYPILSNNRPYYVELYTRRNVNNDFDYLKRLHEFVITKMFSRNRKNFANKFL